ncbi:squalene/phytoene synthase family protein [Candidatus Albibeggiatoa sp. nov. NOAA]|uniref:squalene/phytoene synthase family protein n=1 Tax=Candidatus Albibeggiatoa sp. nov. NOAA TaxID=3162724 RepID=UPI0032F26B3B|nr:squalene/phytoene synthase family protein [Thiotrichaceae bacterium]
MNSQKYCEQKIIKEGSCLYYSLRFVVAEKRHALLLLHTLFHEIDEIKYKCQDIQVAHQKHEWWQQEMMQTFMGKASHPVTQDLSKIMEQYAISQADILTMTDTLIQCPTHFADFKQLETYCQQTSGQLQMLCAKVLGYQKDETLEAAQQLGVMLQLYYFIRELRRDTLNAYIHIPQTELEQFDLTQHILFEQKQTEQLHALLTFQAQRISEYYQSFVKKLPKTDRRQQKMELVRAKLAMATLKEMERDGLAVFQHRISLTPLRKLWITMNYLW